VAACQVHFGGPGFPDGALRDQLAQRIAEAPAGGSIDWVIYYFRDRRLAEALVLAKRRGVAVRICLDGRPRTRDANTAVIALLRDGLGDGLRIVTTATDSLPLSEGLRPRLHEKLYCFSHPRPTAWVGSFNPSGDDPELAPEVIAKIGNHDRAFNLLVELCDEPLVTALVSHARNLHAAPHGFFDRFHASANRSLEFGNTSVHFWPRIASDPINRWLAGLPAGSRVRLAASHVSGLTARHCLTALLRRGVDLEILAESTHRRVPPSMVRRLTQAGATIRRIDKGENWTPMHDKFILVETPTERHSVFGSFNWSEPSRRLNREIGIISADESLFKTLEQRWEVLGQHASQAGAAI
jgi:phosphatidylserine/phosphatidylglycerophosphate/cardiolipin synthase-like enzyme